jgi:small subunit ribosomal protein S1
MSEGTKLDESNDSQTVNEKVSVETTDLKATKIGEISEFEKELIQNDDLNEIKLDASTKEENVDYSADHEKSELEKYLDEESLQVFDYQNGDVIDGTVRSVEKSGLLIDFNFKSDGYVSNSELGINEEGSVEELQAGEQAKFYIKKLETKEGYAILSRKKAQVEELWDKMSDLSKDRETVSVNVVSKVQGGLVVDFLSIKGFIPASQIIKENQDGLEQYVGSVMEVGILQADRRRKKVIFSNKVLKMKPKQDITKLLAEIEVGQTREGKVTSVKDFGVFVDLGGIEGLVHISELSWSRVHHPSEFVQVDDVINVFILGIDKENKKVSLGLKQLQPDPWVEVSNNYRLGTVVEGEITRIVPFGAFIKLEDRLEGLIHISEVSQDRIEKVEDVLKVGDKITAKVIKLIPDEQKIGLSIKALSENSDVEETEVVETNSNEETEVVETNLSEEVDVADNSAEESVQETVSQDTESDIS